MTTHVVKSTASSHSTGFVAVMFLVTFCKANMQGEAK